MALRLVGDGHGRGQLVGADFGHRGLDLGGVVHLELVLHGGLDPGSGNQSALEAHRFFDPLLGPLQALGQGGFVHFGSSVAVELPTGLGSVGLHHHDGHVAVVQNTAGHHHLEGGFGALGIGGVGNPLAVGAVGHSHRADRAGERDTRNAQCRRCAVYGDHVIGVLLVGAQDGSNHVDLVAEPVGKRGPQRPVDQPTRQDGRLGGPALPPEKRAGDLARGIHPLFDVDGEGEEIRSLTHTAGRGCGYQDGGVAHAGHYCPVSLAGQATCLKGQGFVFGTAYGGRDGDGFRHVCSSPDHARSERAHGASSQLERPSLTRPLQLAAGLSLGPHICFHKVARATPDSQRRSPSSAIMPRYRSTSLSLT